MNEWVCLLHRSSAALRIRSRFAVAAHSCSAALHVQRLQRCAVQCTDTSTASHRSSESQCADLVVATTARDAAWGEPTGAEHCSELLLGSPSRTIAWTTLHVACCTLYVIRCMDYVARCMDYVARCMLYVTRYMLHGIRCTLHGVCLHVCQVIKTSAILEAFGNAKTVRL